jgi:hypothetical protein
MTRELLRAFAIAIEHVKSHALSGLRTDARQAAKRIDQLEQQAANRACQRRRTRQLNGSIESGTKVAPSSLCSAVTFGSSSRDSRAPRRRSSASRWSRRAGVSA